MRLEDRGDDDAAVDDEGHEEAEDGAHDDGGLLVVFEVDPDEDEAFGCEDGGGCDCELRVPVKGRREDEAEGAEELEDAEGVPGAAGHGSEGGDAFAYFVEEEELHDAG